MEKTNNSDRYAGLAVPDVVVTKRDSMFWNAMNGSQEVIKRAGTECVIADVQYKNGVPFAVIIEAYDPVANIAWLASLAADEVQLVWKSPR